MPVDETKPFLIFMKPPPGVRAHTAHTPQAGHMAAHHEIQPTAALRALGVRLLDYGAGRFAAQDALHWTGYWPSPQEALDALRRLQQLNAPRVAAWRRLQVVKGAEAAATAYAGPLAGALAKQLAAAAVQALAGVGKAEPLRVVRADGAPEGAGAPRRIHAKPR